MPICLSSTAQPNPAGASPNNNDICFSQSTPIKFHLRYVTTYHMEVNDNRYQYAAGSKDDNDETVDLS